MVGDWFVVGYLIGITLGAMVGKDSILPATLGCLTYFILRWWG